MIEEFGWNANRQAAYSSPLSFAGGDIGRGSYGARSRRHSHVARYGG